jgi:predicted nuclease of restriction endonuclease-like RecB superfamily
MQDDVANRLAHKLGLQQTPGKDVTKKFAERTRELQHGRDLTDDQAAIVAANEIFRSDFVLTRYDSRGEPMEELLGDVQKP